VEKREKRMGKKKSNRHRYLWQHILVKTKRHLVMLCLRWWLDIFGYWRRCHVPSKWREQPPHAGVFLSHASNFLFYFYFIFIFYKYQNISDPTQNLQKFQSEKNTNTSKDKNICFKIQGYFSNITVLKN